MSDTEDFRTTRCSACGTKHTAHDPCPAQGGVRVGTVLEGKYDLVRLLGQGGMGEVYEGRHRVIGRRVAVKFLHGEYARDPEIALRFANEARAAGGSEHENLAAVHDVGVLADGTQYLVMEFLDGEDLDKLVRREAPLPVPRAAFIVIQACRGLDVVHQRGIVHRDLKPANLFLAKRADKTDLVKVLDFGIAKLKTSDGRGGTRTGVAIGTAHYMSPEQARGERSIDARSDVYSLGVILYELLSGKKPHEGDSLLRILHNVITQPPTPLESVRPGLPSALYGVVRRAMVADVAARYATVAELGDALLPFAGRALPAIRSQPGVLAGPRTEVSETRASEPSALDARAPAGGASVVGIVRSDPNASDVARREHGRSGRARALVAAGIVGVVAAAAGVAAVHVLGAQSKPSSGAVGEPTPLTSVLRVAPSPSEATPPTPIASLASTSLAIPDASAAPAVSPDGGPSAAAMRLSGHRTPSSEHIPTAPPAGAKTVAIVPSPAIARSTAPAASTPPSPSPKPAVTDRGDNPF